jgi:serine/threonine-protein kinase
MGEVFAARDPVLGRRVAVKMIAPELADGEGAARRFERECRLASAIDHPHVIPIYEAGQCNGRLFLVMRYVDGVDLRTLVRDTEQLRLQRAVEIASQLASALDAIHTHGLVHRDVKPHNAMITDVGGADHAYLCDFGLAAALSRPSRELTGSCAFIGTVGYAAPEQLRGQPVDARADIYGLGCVLFEMLSGRGPFAGLGHVGKLAAQVTGPPPILSAVRADAPKALDDVLARAMDPSPKRRFASAGALADAALTALDAPVRTKRATHAANMAGPAHTCAVSAGVLTIARAPTPSRRVRLWRREPTLGLNGPPLRVSAGVAGSAARSGWIWWMPSAASASSGSRAEASRPSQIEQPIHERLLGRLPHAAASRDHISAEHKLAGDQSDVVIDEITATSVEAEMLLAIGKPIPPSECSTKHIESAPCSLAQAHAR